MRDKDDGFLVPVWRDIRSPDSNLMVRFSTSLAMALGLVALALMGAWCAAQFSNRGYVRDEHIAIALGVAALLWFAQLVIIWRPMRWGRRFVLPSIVTVAIGVAVLIWSFIVTEVIRIRDEEMLVAGGVLLGFAGVLLTWLSSIRRAMRGRPVIGPDQLVRVNCPKCGYSLIGLHELRCPECGERFTIDELIRAQNYGGVPKVSKDAAEELGLVNQQERDT